MRTLARTPIAPVARRRAPVARVARPQVRHDRAAMLSRLRAQDPEEPLARMLSRAVQERAGAHVDGPILQRVKEKKVGSVKVKYAESEAEAERLCKEEAERNDVDWSKLSDGARTTILDHAQKPALSKDEPGGLPSAFKMIHTERAEAEKRKQRAARLAEVSEADSEYNQLRSRIEGDDILEACLDWMKDIYVAGSHGRENRTLGGTYTRQDISDAVGSWRGERHWVLTNLTDITGPHGYAVGPKDPTVGDTLDRRGDQGNIIATWGGAKMNIHINPSD